MLISSVLDQLKKDKAVIKVDVPVLRSEVHGAHAFELGKKTIIQT